MSVSRWHTVSRIALAAALFRVLAEGHARGIDSERYLAAADALLGDGSLSDERYPPGFPAMLAPLRALDLPAWWATTVSGLVLVVLVWWAATKLGGPVAGTAAGVLSLVSRLLSESGVLLMSDTPATVLVIAALLALLHGRWILAGVFVGSSAWIRLPHAAFLIGSQSLRMALASVAVIGPLAVFNLVVFGSLSTYRSDQASWSIDYFTQALYLDNTTTPYGNAEYYSALLLGRWGYLVPLIVLPAAIEMWTRRREPPTRFAAIVVAVNVMTYLFYFYQSPRFVLPAGALVVVYSAAWVGRIVLATDRTEDVETTPECVD